MKHSKRIFLSVGLALLVTLIALAVRPLLAAPPVPASFYGEVKIDGAYVPVGTEVSAWINGTLYRQVETILFQGASVYSMDVPGDDTDSSGAIEGGKAGDTIVFRVGSLTADQTATWQSGTSTPLNLTAAQGTTVNVSAPANQTGPINTAVTIPINVATSLTGLNVISYQFTLSFDSSVLTYVNYSKTGTLSSNWAVEVNSGTAGQINVAAYGQQALTGTGVLLNLSFTATNTGGAQTALTFSNFKFNEGNPPAQTTNGQFSTVSLGVAGAVTYAESALAVPGATVDLSGPSSTSATTGADGAYSLSVNSTGNYTVVPSKSGDLGSAISAADAARILEHVTGKSLLTAFQQTVANVSQAEDVTAYDAALIARFLVGLTDPPSSTGQWVFTPPSRTYTNLSSNQTGQNFAATLYGDVTGNWASSGAARVVHENGPLLTLPQTSGVAAQRVAVPLSVQGVDGYSIQAYEWRLVYDPAVLKFAGVITDGTLSAGWPVVYNEKVAGEIALVAYSAEPVTEDGVLLLVNFDLVGEVGESSNLELTYLRFNELTPEEAPGVSRGDIFISSSLIYLPALSR